MNRKPKNNICFFDRFIKYKRVMDIIAQPECITIRQKNELERWFGVYGFRESIEWFKQLAIWIQLGVYDFVERRETLEQLGTQKLTREIAIIKYGEENGIKRYNSWQEKSRKNRKNTVDYWLSRDINLTEMEAYKKVIEYQKDLANRKKIKYRKIGKSHRVDSPWCTEYWTVRGISLDEAKIAISKLQTHNVEYFIKKYGSDGEKHYKSMNNKRKTTWNSKSFTEKQIHGAKTLPKTYNKNGQETKAIKLFLSANNISHEYCKFGAPKEQFFQWIPNYGYRRYDLAVFEDLDHTILKLIMEFHGPGHINFSDYKPSMRNQLIAVNGTILPHLGTYGDAFENDTIKKNHILKKFPWVKYVVMWTSDLNNKKAEINELSKSRKN
jgi:hypothetical protein